MKQITDEFGRFPTNIQRIPRRRHSVSLRIRHQGPEHLPQTHRSQRLFVRPWNPPPGFRHSYFRRPVPPRPYDARDPSSERWNCGQKCRPVILPKCRLYTLHLGIFYMPQICDMGQMALLPLRRKACWGFFSPWKVPTALVGFEPSNLGT